jgi:hypothetical protein
MSLGRGFVEGWALRKRESMFDAGIERFHLLSNDTISENVGIDMNGLLRFM